MGFLVLTNGLSAERSPRAAGGKGRHAQYIFSPPDRALRKKTADFLDLVSELAGISSSGRKRRSFEMGNCRERGIATRLQAEVLNQTTVAALAYLDFFLANVAGDPV